MGLEATVSKFALWAGFVVVVAVAPSRASADGDAFRPPRTGVRHFEAGNYDGARSAWERDAEGDHDGKRREAKRMLAALEEYLSALAAGVRAGNNRHREWVTAIRHYETAFTAARKISTEGSRAVGRKLSDVLYLKGRIAFEAGDHATAFRAWSRSLKVDPKQQYARDGLRDLEAQGKEHYLTVHMLSFHQKLAAPRDTVIAKLEEIILTTPDDYEYHLKAKRLLKQLQP